METWKTQISFLSNILDHKANGRLWLYVKSQIQIPSTEAEKNTTREMGKFKIYWKSNMIEMLEEGRFSSKYSGAERRGTKKVEKKIFIIGIAFLNREKKSKKLINFRMKYARAKSSQVNERKTVKNF